MDALRTLAERLRHASDEAACAWLPEQLASLFDADRAAAYGVSPNGEHVTLDWSYCHAMRADFRVTFGDWLARAPRRYGHFDAVRPEPAQRDVALTLGQLRVSSKPAPLPAKSLLSRLDLLELDQMRVLICDGPLLLGWIGCYREQAFGSDDVRRLQKLVPALRDRLRVERRLGGPASAAALVAALEAMGTAAAIVDRRGRIAVASSSLRAAMERDAADVHAQLHAAVAERPSRFALTHFDAPGLGRHSLAVERADATGPGRRIDLAAERWTLTPRQVDVLRELAAGAANKTIAARLGCTEATVEFHVTALLDRAQAESRAQLVAKVWGIS